MFKPKVKYHEGLDEARVFELYTHFLARHPEGDRENTSKDQAQQAWNNALRFLNLYNAIRDSDHDTLKRF